MTVLICKSLWIYFIISLVYILQAELTKPFVIPFGCDLWHQIQGRNPWQKLTSVTVGYDLLSGENVPFLIYSQFSLRLILLWGVSEVTFQNGIWETHLIKMPKDCIFNSVVFPPGFSAQLPSGSRSEMPIGTVISRLSIKLSSPFKRTQTTILGPFYTV